jgi:hypothetical protein
MVIPGVLLTYVNNISTAKNASYELNAGRMLFDASSQKLRLFCSAVTSDDVCQTVIKTGQKNLRFLQRRIRGMWGRVVYQTTRPHIEVGNALHSDENAEKFCSVSFLYTELHNNKLGTGPPEM